MFKKLKELLEAGKVTQDVADTLDSEISASLKELRDESASWRLKYNDINKSLESVSQTKESLEIKLSGFDDAIKKAKEDGKGELVNELETQRQEMQTLQDNLTSIQEQNKSLKIETALNSSLGKYDVVDAELVGNYVKGFVSLDGDAIKYKDGDNSLTLDDGLKKFFENKPHLLKSQGNSGSGAGNQNNSGNEKLTEKERAFLERVKKLKG